MNAYELAEAILPKPTIPMDVEWLKSASNMLRQQADRIAELEKDAEYYKHHYLELVGNYQDLLLKEKFESPTKTLTDEEIVDIADRFGINKYSLKMATLAILRKAQEK